MPLRDHFHPPLSKKRSWEELHGGWPMMLAAALSRKLPSGYVAGQHVHLGPYFEIDVATFEGEDPTGPASGTAEGEHGAALPCQSRDHLQAALPGFADCFDKLWESALPWHLLRCFANAAQLRDAGRTALCHWLPYAGIRFQQRSFDKLLAWAEQAASGDVAASQHLRFALALDNDRQQKT